MTPISLENAPPLSAAAYDARVPPRAGAPCAVERADLLQADLVAAGR